MTSAAFSIAVIYSALGNNKRAKVCNIVSGKLSTQKYPESSKAFVAEDIPEPLNPVIITKFGRLLFSVFAIIFY